MRELLQDTNEQTSDGQECLTDMQRQSLADIEGWLRTEKHEDGTDKWWRFFDAGVRDEHGGIWTLYNNLHNERSPEGWRIFYCPPEQEQFYQLHSSKALHTLIPPTQGHDVVHTVQFDVGGEQNRWLGMANNDILNFMFQDNQLPWVKFWSDKESMQPVPIEQVREEVSPIREMSARALEAARLVA